MRRVMILALVALALPMAAMADAIFTTGTFVSGNLNRNSTGGLMGTLTTQVHGTDGILRLDANVGSPGCHGAGGTCAFTGGTIRFPGTTPLLILPLVGGDVTLTTTTATIEATLEPNSTFSGPGVFFHLNFIAPHGPPCTGCTTLQSGSFGLAGTPEPGTLALLGTSVVGLAGMARRRLKLGK